MKRSPLRRSTKKMRHISKRKVGLYREYSITASEYLKEHPFCQVEGCSKPSEHCHHRAGRGANLLNKEYFLAVCAKDHRFIHDNPAWAKENGYLFQLTK